MPDYREESLKHSPDEFGGFQTFRMPSEAVQSRRCCARFCPELGKAQLAVPGGYRVVCARHSVLVLLHTLGVLGDPSPIAEVRLHADRLGISWESFLETHPIHPTLPEAFSCMRCGGGFLLETQGMFAGKRYVHTCEES